MAWNIIVFLCIPRISQIPPLPPPLLQQLRVYYIQSMCDFETFANGTIIIAKIVYSPRLYAYCALFTTQNMLTPTKLDKLIVERGKDKKKFVSTDMKVHLKIIMWLKLVAIVCLVYCLPQVFLKRFLEKITLFMCIHMCIYSAHAMNITVGMMAKNVCLNMAYYKLNKMSS